MNKLNRCVGLVVILAISLGRPACSQEKEHTFEKTIDSEYLDRPVKLYIDLPPGYHRNSQKYKVIYHLTGGPGMQPVIRSFLDQYTSAIKRPNLIIVGISPNQKPMYIFTPTEVKNARIASGHIYNGPSGGGPFLLKCIEDEVIPWVESTYRADPEDRTLMGASVQGVFCFYTMLQPKQPFKNLIVSSSGHMSWDENYLFRIESERSKSMTSFPVNIFATTGSEDHAFLVPHLERFIKQLNSREYEGLNLHYQVNEGADHVTNKYVSYVMGLKWLLNSMENKNDSVQQGR